jgi:hypothetical protein
MRSTAASLALLLLAATPALSQSLPRLDPVSDPLPGQPVAVVVHGINPTSGQLDTLARDMVSRGYQTLLFHYDDGQDLDKSATELGTLLQGVINQRPVTHVKIVAHSMGGLVARRALTVDHNAGLARRPEQFTLITVASPFGGFSSANWSRMWPFGMGSYHDLGTWARFVTRPGVLGSNVRHIKVQSREVNKVRTVDGKTVDDSVVPLDNQREKTVDAQASRILTLPFGHVGSILDGQGRVPLMLRYVLTHYTGPSKARERPDAQHVAPRQGVVATLQALGR